MSFQLGLHVVQRSALGKLAKRGLELGEPMGVIELLRALEGLASPPAPGVPLTVVGLDVLVTAVGDEANALLRMVRTRLREARRYFDQNRIPLVLLIDGLVESSVAEGPTLQADGRGHALSALSGGALTPMAGVDGWWHVGQVS